MKNDGKNRKNASQGEHPSDSSHSSRPIIPPRGDYQTLHSFHKAEVVYDVTFRFAHKFLARGDRTVDQMIQSARSGKKNILEGSKAATTSKETEIKLTNVARASLEELLDDFRDYLRAVDIPLSPSPTWCRGQFKQPNTGNYLWETRIGNVPPADFLFAPKYLLSYAKSSGRRDLMKIIAEYKDLHTLCTSNGDLINQSLYARLKTANPKLCI